MLLNQGPFGVGLLIASMAASGWCSNLGKEAHGVSLWKHIRAGWISFSHHISFQVGDGCHIRFWYDLWCGDQPLRDRFPVLFCLSRKSEAMVADHLQFHGSNHIWDVEFSRAVQDWELDLVESFMELLYSTPVRQGSLNAVRWNISRREVFEVSSFYSALPHTTSSFYPWRSVWRAKVPSRVGILPLDSIIG